MLPSCKIRHPLVTSPAHQSLGLRALLRKAVLGWLEVDTTILILVHDIAHVRGGTVEVHVLAAGRLDELGSCPHANAPAVAIVCTNLIVPLDHLLASDLPEVTRAPAQGLLRRVQQLSAHPVGLIMVALSVAAALPGASVDITITGHRLLPQRVLRVKDAKSRSSEDKGGSNEGSVHCHVLCALRFVIWELWVVISTHCCVLLALVLAPALEALVLVLVLVLYTCSHTS